MCSCRDLGLWVEAEQLLSDVCNYYSEDQWSHLFIKAYSLLAECQNQLKMEDKYPLNVVHVVTKCTCEKVQITIVLAIQASRPSCANQ